MKKKITVFLLAVLMISLNITPFSVLADQGLGNGEDAIVVEETHQCEEETQFWVPFYPQYSIYCLQVVDDEGPAQMVLHSFLTYNAPKGTKCINAFSVSPWYCNQQKP